MQPILKVSRQGAVTVSRNVTNIQEAQLSRRSRAVLRVTEYMYFAKSLGVI